MSHRCSLVLSSLSGRSNLVLTCWSPIIQNVHGHSSTVAWLFHSASRPLCEPLKLWREPITFNCFWLDQHVFRRGAALCNFLSVSVSGWQVHCQQLDWSQTWTGFGCCSIHQGDWEWGGEGVLIVPPYHPEILLLETACLLLGWSFRADCNCRWCQWMGMGD